MNTTLRWALVLAAIVSVGRAQSRPSAPPELSKKVEQLVQPIVADDGRSGAAVGVITPGGEFYFGFGRPSRKSEQALGRDTVFEIGSITKVFTCIVLAQLVESGDMSLEDPVQRYLPDSLRVPSDGQREIRLVDLATHHSGLPRMPDNFQPRNPMNPYADYDVDKMYAFLNDHELRRAVGSRYEYSNLGMGLLGHALCRKLGTDYESMVVARICKPLGMKDTVIELAPSQRERLARGHLRNGMATLNWDIPALAGAGALRGTVHDLIRLAAACLAPSDDAFGRALTLSMQPVEKLGGDARIALGWHLDGDGEDLIVWHNGATGGYCSYLGLWPSRGFGVAVLCNRQQQPKKVTPRGIGRGVLEFLGAGH